MRERPTTLREARERFGNVPQKRIAILRRERPRRRAAEQRYELAPPHSITFAMALTILVVMTWAVAAPSSSAIYHPQLLLLY
jgi:hypothetical protein